MDLMIRIDRSDRLPLVEQVYWGIRAAIADATLGPGVRLPSTRELARQLGVTRFTVDDAYSRLTSEGYLEARHGSGTYVAARVRLPPVETARPAGTPPARRLSAWAARLPPEPLTAAPQEPVAFNFSGGTPAFDRLPLATWRRLIVREVRDATDDAFTYGHTGGLAALREAIAAYVGRSRGVTCDPEQVIVTSGTQQSIDLVMRMVLEPGATVIVEEPCYRSVRNIATLSGATVRPVPVDTGGLMVDRLPPPSGDVRLVCITPSHQYPTGAIMPLARRLALLEWAQAAGALVMEDDYDGELRYDSRPLPALAALATSGGNVIYSGSFSKVLFPSIRLGYLIVPPDLVTPFLRAKAIVERHAPTLSQAAVAAFIAEGHFERHLAKMRRLYAGRHDALIAAMDAHLAGIATRNRAMRSAGLHVLARFELDLTEAEIVARAWTAAIAIDPAGSCFAAPPDRPHLFLGYTAMPEERIHAGIARLAGVLRDAPRLP
jgi:GntR family transcriptional regulator/MocR family aminotransferase